MCVGIKRVTTIRRYRKLCVRPFNLLRKKNWGTARQNRFGPALRLVTTVIPDMQSVSQRKQPAICCISGLFNRTATSRGPSSCYTYATFSAGRRILVWKYYKYSNTDSGSTTGSKQFRRINGKIPSHTCSRPENTSETPGGAGALRARTVFMTWMKFLTPESLVGYRTLPSI